MKKFVTMIAAGALLTVAACANTDSEADYSYESQAPYGDERTVGDDGAQGDMLFERRQRK